MSSSVLSALNVHSVLSANPQCPKSAHLGQHRAHSVALHFMHYNFARVHQTLRVTPAMEAGVADHVWTIEEIVRLIPNEDVVILR